MKRTLPITIAAILAATSLTAHANPIHGNGDQDQGQGQTQTQSNGQGQSQTGTVDGKQTQSAITGPSTSQGGNATGGAGGASQSASGAQAGSASASNADGSSSNSYTNINPRSPVNSAFAAPGMTTAGCRFSDAIGVSTFVLGLSFSKSRLDSDCRKVEMANNLYARGLTVAANKITCTVSYVHAALGADCETLLIVPVKLTDDSEGRVYHPPVADAVTHAELREVESRIVAASTRK